MRKRVVSHHWLMANGYLLVALFGICCLLITNCSRTSPNSLRIISINDDNPMRVDIIDHFVDENDEEQELISDQIVKIEVGYIEQGIGLPTYPTVYTARVTDYRVKFKRIKVSPTDNDKWSLQDVTGVTNLSIPADPELRTAVKSAIKILPCEWIDFYRDSLEDGVILKATVILNGYEELTNNAISDTGFVTIDIADYYDDPLSRNSK